MKNNQTKSISHHFSTRSKLYYVMPSKEHKSTTKSSFSFIGPNIYNNIPYELRDYSNYVILKLKINRMAITTSC